MKVIIKLLLLACVVISYVTVKAQAHGDYQAPTFIGATHTERLTLLEKLSSAKSLEKPQQRKLLLLQLAMFANSKDRSLVPLEKLTVRLQDYLKTNKTDAEIMAATGSATSLQSIFYQDNLGKMNYLSRKGMRMMDRAVKRYPNNLGARLMRGLSYANMPAFLMRASFAQADLALVKKHMAGQADQSFVEFVDHYLAMATAKNPNKDSHQ
jgi:hypothetical protein